MTDRRRRAPCLTVGLRGRCVVRFGSHKFTSESILDVSSSEPVAKWDNSAVEFPASFWKADSCICIQLEIQNTNNSRYSLMPFCVLSAQLKKGDEGPVCIELWRRKKFSMKKR